MQTNELVSIPNFWVSAGSVLDIGGSAFPQIKLGSAKEDAEASAHDVQLVYQDIISGYQTFILRQQEMLDNVQGCHSSNKGNSST